MEHVRPTTVGISVSVLVAVATCRETGDRLFPARSSTPPTVIAIGDVAGNARSGVNVTIVFVESKLKLAGTGVSSVQSPAPSPPLRSTD